MELKKIRAVGRPEERFKEDYSRMLRALRLSCQLDFDIENNTWKAILKNIKNLNKKSADDYLVSREVIAKELVKSFDCNPVWALELLDKAGVLKMLMPELLKMKNCPQPEKFHAEGDVWKHTKLALNFLNSKKFKQEFLIFNFQFQNKFKNSNSKIDSKLKIKNLKLIPSEVIWGLLFHDVGKPYTITFADRIRFNEHDTTSVKIFRKTAERLKLSSAGLNVDLTEKIIGKHMLPTHGQIENMKETTIEKYFFNPDFPGRELMMLIYADISATIPPSGKPDFSSYNQLKNRIKKLAPKTKNKKNLPKEILDGNEIMKILKIQPGPKIKEIKEYLREKQLAGKIKNKKEAKKIITEKYGNDKVPS